MVMADLGIFSLFLKRDMSVQYLTPPAVVDYISRNHLYEDDTATASGGSGAHRKGKEREANVNASASQP